jgi:hypothetical protein
MEAETQAYKLFELEFLDGDLIYIGKDIKAKNLEEAKRVAMAFLDIPHDSELIFSKETLIH